MKKLIVFTILTIMSANSFAAVIRSENRAKDPREIRIQKKQDGKTYFALCANSTVTKCTLIGKKGFTDEQILKKFKKERFRVFAKSGAVAVAAAAGAYLGIAAIATSGLVTVSGVITGGGYVAVGTTTAALGSLTYKIEDMVGRSPIEHYQASNLLKLKPNGVIRTADIDETYELYKDILTEIR